MMVKCIHIKLVDPSTLYIGLDSHETLHSNARIYYYIFINKRTIHFFLPDLDHLTYNIWIK
jgi:hypothetical protein